MSGDAPAHAELAGPEPAGAEPSARAWIARLRARECSARELTRLTLDRITAVDGELHAVCERRDEETLAAADAADRELARGTDLPLLGLPITIKDALDVCGWRTSSGSLARVAHRASGDATVVARLRAAGAIPVAKTNVPECCCSYETDNLIHGRTNHPLDPARTPGGSSGGEAALLGADASIAGIGTDGGGSIRVPSHYCGLPGLRPTVGRTPETGHWPPNRPSGSLDYTCVGPMARTVGDIDLLLRVIMGADLIDPYAVDTPFERWSPDDVASLRVGFYTEHPRAPAATDTTIRAVRDAAATLERAGAHVEEVQPPDAGAAVEGRSATELFFEAAGADGGAGLRRWVAAAGGRHHPQFLALLGDPDAPAPSADAFFQAQARCFAYRAHVRAAMHEIDLLLSPVVTGPAPEHGRPPAGVNQEEYMRYEAFEYCHINAVAGLPAASVPVASESGLPVGVQVAAAPWREDRVLAAAAALEEAHGGFAINRSLAATAGATR